jgi:hypothetical protein
MCEGCSAAFHNICAINNVYDLFKGQKELQDVGDNKCGRCGPWILLETPAVEHMSVDEGEGPLCVIADLAVVRRGRYACLDRVLCCVPGCKYASGEGLLRESVPDHFTAAKVQATHGAYTVVETERAPLKRARPPPKPSAAATALLKSTFFLTAAEKRAAAQAPTAPAAAPAAEEAAPESGEAAAAPAPVWDEFKEGRFSGVELEMP